MTFYGSNTVYVVGDNGTIYHAYTSYIDYWYMDTSNTNKDLYALNDRYDYYLRAAGEKYFALTPHRELVPLASGIEDFNADLRLSNICGSSSVQLRFTPQQANNIAIVIYDVSGRILHESDYVAEIGSEMILNLEDFLPNFDQAPAGLYTCLVRDGNEFQAETFVLVR